MYKIVSLLALYMVLLTFSCSTKNNSTVKKEIEIPFDEQSFDEVEKDIQEEQKSEVYTIEEKAVVFFIVSKKEAQVISKEIGEIYQWETEFLFRRFTDQSNAFKDVLKKHNISSTLSHNRRFEIILKNGKSISFDRIKEDQILGEILTNGEKEPIISYGMYSNKDLGELIMDFFNIENLGYVPLDTLYKQPDNIEMLDSNEVIVPIVNINP